mmetsp:Transcript_5389/g.8270  ORF Transcript_5389/g.8270 Transcript_5389/m.8270 type:complete len:87 (+) Transcript_5389:646-906(+)
MDYSDQLSSTSSHLFIVFYSSSCLLTFAYISDAVKESRGLALATFGLGFTVAVGPLLGGYLANVEDNGKGQGGEVSVRCRDICKHA